MVVDGVGHFPAYAPAEALVDAGASVAVLSPKLYLGSGLDQATMTTMLRRLAGKGVDLVANTMTVGIAGGSVVVRDTLAAVERTEPADLVVAAVGNRAVDDLVDTLSTQSGVALRVVGDAAAPRTVLEAIREGRMAGRDV